MKRVNLHIDCLVLRGFNHEDRHAISDGIQQELSRMLADPQTTRQFAGNGDVSRLRIGNLRIGYGARPQSIGTKVAQSIGKGLKK